MGIFDSITRLSDLVGWSPDSLLLIFAFFLAVYWIISILGLGLATALWLQAFSWIFRWFSNRRKK